MALGQMKKANYNGKMYLPAYVSEVYIVSTSPFATKPVIEGKSREWNIEVFQKLTNKPEQGPQSHRAKKHPI